mmetsp:Transcript_74965/g.181195  ORF Transcript_74965/g.181195 Transcript_74965/m.181195 type:complete len:112 (+) Transcript_74965:335-670(+)
MVLLLIIQAVELHLLDPYPSVKIGLLLKDTEVLIMVGIKIKFVVVSVMLNIMILIVLNVCVHMVLIVLTVDWLILYSLLKNIKFKDYYLLQAIKRIVVHKLGMVKHKVLKY